MSDLQVFQAELERLEREDRWDDPGYDFLVQRIEELKAAEPTASPPASAPTTSGQPEADLATRMLAMQANPERYSDAQREEIIREYNTAVMAAGQSPGADRIDAAAVLREMVAANADPGALTHEQRADLVSRYNQAIRQGPERRTSEALHGELASGDLASRMRAAAELQQRGELDDATADEIVAGYNAEVQEAARSIGDPDAYPPELRPIVQGFREAQEAQRAAERRAPADVAVDRFNDFVRGLRPPSLEDQLAALGVSAAPTGDGDE